MVIRRTGILIAFLILLSPVTALPVAQVIGLKNVRTQVTTVESTVAYTNVLLNTYFGSSQGMTVAQTAARFPERVIGFMAPQGKCALFSLPVTADSGTVFTVEMTANSPVNFYLFSEYPSNGLTECKVSGTPLVAQTNFTDYTLNWTAPQDGVFYFIFTGQTGVVLLSDHGSVKPIEQSATITQPTSTETELSTSTTVINESSTITVTSPLYLQATSELGLLIIGVMTALAVIILFLIGFKSRGR